MAVIHLRNPHRPADRESVVVLVVGRNFARSSLCLAVEEPNRVEKAVAVDLEQISVELVRTWSHLVSDRSLTKAELCGKRGALDTEFADELVRRIDVGRVAFRFRLGKGNSVENDFLLKVHTTIETMGEGVARSARREELKAVDLASATTDFVGQRPYDFRFDCRSELRLSSVQRNAGGGNLNRFRCGTGGHCGVDGRLCTDVDVHAILHIGFESGGLYFHCVMARIQAGDGKCACIG